MLTTIHDSQSRITRMAKVKIVTENPMTIVVIIIVNDVIFDMNSN